MVLASCILLCFAAVASRQHEFTYMKPWDPFRSSATECEMCYKGDCVQTDGPRCDYYADASKLISDDDSDDDKMELEIPRDGNKIDNMLFELVDLASSTPQFKGCIPLVSQHTDCTEENICIGCKFCSCNETGSWVCSEKQKCRPNPQLTVDNRVVGTVMEKLKRKEKTQQKRNKRSAVMKKKSKNDKLTYTDIISKWMYELPLKYEEKNIDVERILEDFNRNDTAFDKYTDIGQAIFLPTVPSESHVSTTYTPINKSDNYVDLLEFNDILESWTKNDLSTKKSFTVTDKPRYEDIHINNIDNSDYDFIRLIKRDTSKLETDESSTVLQTNTTNNNFTYELVLIDALEGLSKITNEKQNELEVLMNIQNNLLNIAKAHNIAITVNSTHDNYNKHHIAIYKCNIFEKCTTKLKYDICSALDDVIRTDSMLNSSDLRRDLQLIFNTIRKYVVQEKVKTKANNLSSHEYGQDPRRHIELDNEYKHLKPIKYMGSILAEINKASANPLRTLSQHARKILKRIIKQLYLDDFAVIDYIVHETYYDFDSYMENIGIKWNKMMQNVINSDISDTLYKVKLLHITLKADISKMEDMITLLDFARNTRMTITNEDTLNKSILRIQNNIQLIDSNVQKIMKLQKTKRMRQTSAFQQTKPAKKKSILEKLKKMFQSSKNEIKEMLRKRFPKSEIMKQIAKKKLDELETRRMLEYQETVKQWHKNFNVIPARKKRSAWGLQSFAVRIKSIIPGYLIGKVKPEFQNKIDGNKTQIRRMRGGKKKRRTKPTIKTTTVSERSSESK